MYNPVIVAPLSVLLSWSVLAVRMGVTLPVAIESDQEQACQHNYRDSHEPGNHLQRGLPMSVRLPRVFRRLMPLVLTNPHIPRSAKRKDER
jgi:hypothetical protein